MILRLFILLVSCVFAHASGQEQSELTTKRFDHTKVLGAQTCAECHQEEAAIWKQSAHYRTYFEMHRLRYGQKIAKRMGYSRIKADTSCVRCHYLPQEDAPLTQPNLISGVSCEHCHGPAKDWNKTHSNPDDPNRLSNAKAMGMVRPMDAYNISKSCFECHIIDDEELVNKGDHHTFSNFELVAWLSGEVRHNVHRNHASANPEASIERRRVLYLTGLLLDVEFTLKALSKSTKEGNYRTDLLNHLDTLNTSVRKAHSLTKLPLLEKVSATIPNEFEPPTSLIEKADQIARLNKQLIAKSDHFSLEALDSLLPRPDQYIGEVVLPKR